MICQWCGFSPAKLINYLKQDGKDVPELILCSVCEMWHRTAIECHNNSGWHDFIERRKKLIKGECLYWL